MANVTENQITDSLGSGPYIFHLPVKASTKIVKNTMVCQHSAGRLVNVGDSGAGIVVGVSQDEADNSSGSDGDKRARVMIKTGYVFDNDGSNAFTDLSQIGAVCYATDNHTVGTASSGGKPCGFYLGLESDSKVRVFIDPQLALIVSKLQALTDAPATADALRDNIVASFG